MEPISKLDHRVKKNFLSAAVMLGHLCALYDKGVFEAGRLMSNLLFQLAVKNARTNTPLIEQVGMADVLRVFVDETLLGPRVTSNSPVSPLVGLILGMRRNAAGEFEEVSLLLPGMRKPDAGLKFAVLSIEDWLNDRVIPTSQGVLSRKDLIKTVRDRDGGAHSDPDLNSKKSIGYVELIDSFPISKFSAVEIMANLFARPGTSCRL